MDLMGCLVRAKDTSAKGTWPLMTPRLWTLIAASAGALRSPKLSANVDQSLLQSHERRCNQTAGKVLAVQVDVHSTLLQEQESAQTAPEGG